MDVRYVKVASRFFRVKGGESSDLDLHYLDACFLCKRDITCNRDIFMYKGDAAFCSDDCRQDQIDMDEALKTVARRQRLLHKSSSTSSSASNCAANKTAVESAHGEVVGRMHRRPTIANLAARTPIVAG